MAVDVLCNGVDDDVGAMIEGVLDVGRQEGVVDDDHNAAGVGGGGDSADVDEAQGGVGGGLDPDELGGVGNVLADVNLDLGGEGHFDAVGLCDLGEVAVGAAIDIGDGDDMGTGGEALEDDGGGGGTGREGQGVLGVLDGGNGSLEVGAVRVAAARVLKGADGLAEAGLGKSGGQRDGLNDGASDGIVGRAGVHGEGAEACDGGGRARRCLDGLVVGVAVVAVEGWNGHGRGRVGRRVVKQEGEEDAGMVKGRTVQTTDG